MAIAFFVGIGLIALVLAAVVAAPMRKDSPRAHAVVVVLLPLLALALYQLLGAPAALDPAARAPAPVADDAPVDPATFAEAVAQLRAELERNPDQPEGWPLLARSLAMQGDLAGARDAYARAVELLPDDPVMLVEAAQASAQAHPEHVFDDEAMARLERALALQPDNQRARWFIGVAQRQRGLDAAAAATWEPLLAQVDAATAASLRTQVNEARTVAGLDLLPGAAPTAVPATSEGLRIRVSLDPDFAARVRLHGDAVVFVSARIPGGPPMPVAAERHTVQDLPLEIVLDDSDSPMPTQKLSALDEVEVFARLSASGSATRQDGDIDSEVIRVSLPSSDVVELVIGAPGQ